MTQRDINKRYPGGLVKCTQIQLDKALVHRPRNPDKLFPQYKQSTLARLVIPGKFPADTTVVN